MPLLDLFRRPETECVEYPHEVVTFRLPREGAVRYAQWQHPQVQAVELEQDFVDGLRQYVKSGDFAIDIGAHAGDTTLPIALAAGREGCVLALEPNPYAFKVLEHNAELNQHAAHIEPRCWAATAENGSFTFFYGDPSFCNGGKRAGSPLSLFKRRYPLAVEGRKLSQVLTTEYADRLSRWSFLKVDAEGYDTTILRSLQPLLAKHRPTIRCEVFKKLTRTERNQLHDLLSGLGYRIHRYQEGACLAGPEIPRDGMLWTRHFDLLAVRR